nr:putative L-type lectin-domain containing receptor kinase V.6 [Quercus suber]
MEVKSRKPFFFNKALLEHREQVLQRQRPAPPCVLPVQKSLPFIGSRKPFLYSMEELADMTDNFSEKNLIGETLFTKLYRGTIRQDWLPFEDWVVTVKIWDYTLQSDKAGFLSSCYLNTNESLIEEVMFLTQPSAKQHPNVVNLLGYCNRRYLEAVVYDLNPLDTVHNLATTGNKEKFYFN